MRLSKEQKEIIAQIKANGGEITISPDQKKAVDALVKDGTLLVLEQNGYTCKFDVLEEM